MDTLTKTYTYPDDVIIQLGKEVDRAIRIDKSISVLNPNDADFIIVPATLYSFKSRDEMMQLPYFKEYENKHVFFHCSDNNNTTYNTTAILFQCNLKQFMLDVDKNSIATAWPVGKDDIDGCFEFEGFKYDVGFHGWLYSDWRKASVKSVQETDLSFDYAGYPDFAGYLNSEGEEWKKRRKQFLNSLKYCRIQLCPQSVPGDWPYRAWETMCAGRVAALICSGDVRPRTDIIDYDEFILTIPADQAHKSGEIIKEYLSKHTDEQLIEKGKKAREAYTRYLDSRHWDRFFRETLKQHKQDDNTCSKL